MPKRGHVPQNRVPRTDSIEVFPAGRGHIVSIVKKSVPPKPRKKKDPKFVHYWLPSNPDNIALVEYLTHNNIKRIYLFPEGRQLSYDERFKLCASLIVSIYRSLDKSETSKRARVVFPNELREEVKRQIKRYENWRKRQK